MTGMSALSAAGTGISAVSSIFGGSSTKSASESNAKLSEQKGQAYAASASQNAQETWDKTGQTIGKQQAGGTSSNAIGGSLVNLQATTARRGATSSGVTAAEGQQTKNEYDYQASIDRTSGSNAQTASYLNAGSTILTGASKAYGSSSGSSGGSSFFS
jgi:hypothetical protein